MPSRSRGRSKHGLAYDWAIVTAAVTLIAFVLVAGAWTWKLDQVLYDAGITLQEHAARADVVIVAIDESSLAATGRWPWRRSVIAALVDRISAAKPKAVGVDILFAEPDYRNPGDDKQLASALKRTPNAILPVLSLRGRELMPIRSLAESARLAEVGVDVDPDGVLRRVSLQPGMAGDDESSESSNESNMAQVMVRLSGAAISELPEDYPIPFVGPPGSVRRVSAAALLRGEVPLSALAGKYVLLGMTANGVADFHATPSATGARQMPSVEVTANILSGLLDGRQIRALDKYSVGLVSAAAMLLLLAIFYRVGPSVSLSLMFATVFLTPVLALVLLGWYGIWFPPMSVAISALVAYPLWHWKRLEAICHSLDEEIVRLESEQHDAPQALPSGTVGFADYIQNRIELIRININYLRAARKFLNESLDGLPFAALVVAPNGQLVVANRQALVLCQLERGDLSTCNIARALARISLAGSDWLQAVSVVLNGDKLELKASDASGREFEVALASFRNDEGIVSGLIVVLEDVTELHQAQREREDALSFLSHDIRSPQNSILALAELQRHGETRKAEPEFVSNVEGLAQKTMMLAEDFLQLVRADSKPLSLAEYALSDLVEDCIAEVEPQAAAKHVAIQMQAAARVTVDADRSLLTRAIGNLLINAIKYTPTGGKIAVFCEASDGKAVFGVTDSGPGIREVDLPKLFKRFSRVNNADSSIAGSGLGLAFVDVVARRHEGQAQVKSVAGQGATFSLLLPQSLSGAGIGSE